MEFYGLFIFAWAVTQNVHAQLTDFYRTVDTNYGTIQGMLAQDSLNQE